MNEKELIEETKGGSIKQIKKELVHILVNDEEIKSLVISECVDIINERLVEELEKIKAEIGKCSDYVITNHNNTEADMNKLDGIILAITIIDTEIAELKGENKCVNREREP